MKINITTHGSGKPLVLFHGWGFDSQIWHSIVPSMSEQYQLYLVDLPGFGLTPYMDWDKFKSQLLRQVPDSFALIGWSMGGMVATRLAIEEPTRVTHLVNIASSPRFIKDAKWPGVDMQVFSAFYDNLACDPANTLEQFIKLQTQGHAVPVTPSTIRPSMAGLREGLELLVNWDLRQPLEVINTPACFMFGRLDAITPRTTLSAMQASYPDFQYVLFPKAAHIPFLSHPLQFVAALEGFLQ